MSKFFLTARKNLRANSSGQAAVELAMTTVILLVLMCAAADFGCALNDMQILSELTRQGSNLASRGTTLAQTNADLLAGDSGLGLSSNGRVVITQLTQATPKSWRTLHRCCPGVLADRYLADEQSGAERQRYNHPDRGTGAADRTELVCYGNLLHIHGTHWNRSIDGRRRRHAIGLV